MVANISSSFKYKSSFIGDTVADGAANRKKEGVKIDVSLKYLSNSWRSLEMPLINCKIELSLKRYEKCLLCSAGTAATFTITDTKLYVPIVTLKTKDDTKLSKLLTAGFERSVYWDEYKVIYKNYDKDEYIRESLDGSIQGFNKLFVLGDGDNFTNEKSYKKYFLSRVKIENYNIEINGRNFYDQPIII